MVGELEREGRGHGGLVDLEATRRPENELELDVFPREPGRVQLVETEVLDRHHVELRRHLDDPVDLERAGHDVAPAVPFRVQERVRHRDRHLVPHLG